MQNSKIRRGTMVMFAAAILLAALLLVSQSVWATPGQDQLRQTVPTPVPQPGDITIVLPPQPSGDDYTFVYTPLPSVPCAPAAGCSMFSNFTLDAYLGSSLVYPVSFDPPLEICVNYTQAQADANGGADNLAVVYWDDATSTRVPLDNGRYDANLMMVCGDIAFLPSTACGFGVSCALSPTGVPVTGEGQFNMTPVWLVLAAVLVLSFGTIAWRRAETN
jgi:hypothetical protein